LNPDETFSTYVQDTLRGSTMKSMPFFDQKQVVGLLDSLPEMDEGARTANDQILMLLVSMCVLHQRFGLAA
jgi:asparagine synthase (glutamine-hydrolysing)